MKLSTMSRNKLAALSAVIWSVAAVIVVALVLGAVLSEFDEKLRMLVGAMGGAV